MKDYERIQVEQHDKVVVLRFKESKILDEMSIRDVGEEMLYVVNHSKGNRFVIDLSQVEFLSSAVLAKLIRVHQRVKSRKGRLMLAGVQPGIAEGFRVTKLDRLFSFARNVEDALGQLL